MNAAPLPPFLRNESSPESHPPSLDELALERQMRELGLSSETRRFLRNLHAAEKQLNDAFSVAHRDGDLEQRVSQVYREMYGAD
jgi:tellurite resistance protein